MRASARLYCGMVTQLEVAKAAVVSACTVSLALNNHPRVSARTALRVQQVADQLGYVPNHAARQLIRARFGASAHVDLRQVGVISCGSDEAAVPLATTSMAFLKRTIAAASEQG